MSDTDSYLGHISRIMADDVKRLHREKSAVQSAFTRTENRLNELISKPNSDHTEVERGIQSLEKTFEHLTYKVAQLEEVLTEDNEERANLNSYVLRMRERLTAMKWKVQLWFSDTVKPTDSVSQVRSHASDISSRSQVAAKRAGLQVKMDALKKIQELKVKKLEIELQEESLHMETELAAAVAEENALSQVSEHTPIKVKPEPEKIHQQLNPQPTLHPEIKVKPHVDKLPVKPEPESMPEEPEPQSTPEEPDPQPTPHRHRLNPGAKAWTSSPYSRQPIEGPDNFQYELLHMLQLPKTEILKFDGNPLKYWSFIRSFDNSIGETSISDSSKLNRLMQYCTGSALEVIDCCVIMDPQYGYSQARKLLYERFGNQHVISKAWIHKITEGPTLKPNDVTELRRYADIVRGCVVTLKAMGRISEIDNQLRMKKIVEKLPFNMQARWRQQAVGCMRATGEYPDIDHLAQFVEMIAEEVNDPVFGLFDNTVKPPPQPQGFKKNPASSFAVQESSKPYGSCKCCGENHYLYRCEAFNQMELKQRLAFVIKNKLCFNCFSCNHTSPTCPKNSMCGVNNCTRKHSSMLHDSSRTQAKPSTASPNIDVKVPIHDTATAPEDHPSHQSSVYGSGVNGAGSSRIALPIVPVCVKGNDESDVGIQTYALLDPGSTNSFCSEELASALNVQGSETLLSLNTLTDKNSTARTKMVSLSMTDLGGRQPVLLSKVFVLPHMSVLDESIVSPSEIQKWDHLKDIHLPTIDGPLAKVTLLIGQDNPLVLTPIDVRTGEPGQPYATRSVLGWTINGPLQQGNQHSVQSNFVKVGDSLDMQNQKFWQIDNISDGDPQHSVQKSSLSSDIDCLVKDRPIKKISDEDVLCVGGRLKNAPMPEVSKHQMILPKGHSVVTHIIRDAHKRLGHSGTEHYRIRQKYWILAARRTIKKVLNSCVICKRPQGQPCNQKVADLSCDRATPDKAPFVHAGGSWERQIRAVRKVLNFVNSRPITVVPDAPQDIEPFTPILLNQ